METENGDTCFETSGNLSVDFFFHFTRSYQVTSEEMEKLWKYNPNQFIQILKHARDVRNGKGEKLIVRDALLWLRQHKRKTYHLNKFDFTINLGCIKDLLHLANGKHCGEMDIIVDMLREDMEEAPDGHISLAAKWAPSIGKQFSHLAKYIALKLFPTSKSPYKQYRKLLTRLRKKLNIVETKLCAKKWDEIEYEKLPSRAHHLLRTTFCRHDMERYQAYVEQCKTGKAKINTGALFPHELVHECFGDNYDETIQVMWDDMISNMKVKLKSSVAIVDVSGSMLVMGVGNVIPIEVAIALGLMIAELCDGPFKNRVLTFDSFPQWHIIDPLLSLQDKVKQLSKAPWGGSTNLRASFDLILSMAITSSCPPSDMPQTLYIFSDMQFNRACHNSSSTFEYAKQKFESHGYSLPSIVFWNLNGKHRGLPVQITDHNVALVSGFSPSILKLLLNGKLNPVGVMEDAIQRYHDDIDETER
jgi:hypothetical protein